MAAPASQLLAERQLYIRLFVAAVLKNAANFEIRLTSQGLRELDGHLKGAGY